MKSLSIYSPARAMVGCVVLACSLMACGHLPRGSDPRQEKDLDEVVEALQYAIEAAAASKVWKATEQEGQHWTEACTDAKNKAAAACFATLTKAAPLCQQSCTGPNCNPAGLRQCEMLVKGEAIDQLCSGPQSAGKSDWCAAAKDCNGANRVAARMCENAASIAMPELIKGDVVLSVERKRDLSGSVNLLIVSFGGGRSEVSNNQVKMTLKPRVRDEVYGSATLTSLPTAKGTSQGAQALAADLAKVITDAVAASVKEYETDTPGVPKRGPVLVSDLEVTFSLTVDSNGKLGIKKAWETPASVEFGGELGTKRANSLTVTYARPK